MAIKYTICHWELRISRAAYAFTVRFMDIKHTDRNQIFIMFINLSIIEQALIFLDCITFVYIAKTHDKMTY